MIGCLVLTLAGCSMPSDEQADKNRGKSMPSRKAEVKEANVSDQRWPSGNPAEWPGVKVYRPRKLEHTSYDRSTDTIVDLDTGDALKLGKQLGPGDEERSFGFYNQKTGPYGGGFFVSFGAGDSEIYAIIRIGTGLGAERRYRAREEFDVSRLAELFRAHYNLQIDHMRQHRTRRLAELFGAQYTPPKSLGKPVLVVDARPEKVSEINPQNGTRKDAQ